MPALLALALAPAAAAQDVALVVVPDFSPAKYAGRGAVGLYVPAAGTRTSREGALAALVRGRTYDSVAGGVPSGPKLVALSRRPAATTIYVALPPAGSRPNDRRYPVALVGSGYRGLLTSRSTRIDGLVSLADIAPTVRALERGERPVIRWRGDPDPAIHLERLDRRIARANRASLAAELFLAGSVLGSCLLALALRSPRAGLAAVATAPAVLASGLLLSAVGVTQPWLVTVLLACLTAAGALVAAAMPRRLAPALAVGIVATYLVVLVGWPEVNSLAAIGPHVADGGRFYGLTNLTGTVLLAMTLFAGAQLGLRWLVPVAALGLVTAGWSRAGADGGGLVVLLAGLAVLGFRLSGVRPSLRLAGAAALAVAAVALALVGVDAATGGESHLTRAVAGGPGNLAGDLGHRIHASAERFVSSWYAATIVCVSVAALAFLGTRRPRFAAGDALLVALALSLVVNDHPIAVGAAGALSYGVVWTWQRVGVAQV